MVKQVVIDSVNLDITLGATFKPSFTQSFYPEYYNNAGDSSLRVTDFLPLLTFFP
jgi:hypothetical protein